MEDKEKNSHPTKSSFDFSNSADSASGNNEKDNSVNLIKEVSSQDPADDILMEELEEGEIETEALVEEPEQKPKKGRGKPKPAKEIDIETLKNELNETSQKASEYFEGWQRERADFSNYRKRVERDQNEMSMISKSNVLKKYLVIMDDLELALKSRPDKNADSAWVNGIELIYRKLKNFLEAEGVKPIPEVKEFDPNLHEAVTHEENPDFQSGEIIEIIQQGYMLGNRILRPAQVRVAK